MDKVKKNDEVIVIGTNLKGKVLAIGPSGVMAMLRLTSEHSAFDRTVYHVNELKLLTRTKVL